MNKIELISKLLSVGIVGFTIYGYLLLQTHYWFFGIQIMQYLDISEVLTLLYSNYVILVMIIMTAISIIYYYMKVVESKETSKKEEDEKAEKILEKKELASYYKKRIDSITNETNKYKRLNKKRFYYFTVPFITLLTFWALSNLMENRYVESIFPFVMALIILLGELTDSLLIKIFHNKPTNYLFSGVLIPWILIFFAHTFSETIVDAYNLKKKDYIKLNISFKYNNELIKTNEELKYIGQTKKNLFIYDVSKNETLLYKTEKIDDFKIYN